MNLELPFDVVPTEELDALLARIDRELDALFLDEVAVERLRAERPAATAGAAA